MIESFATTPLQTIIPSYLYQEYSDDPDLQAFVNSQNMLAQGYLDWFTGTPLGLYVSPNITGSLLDWLAQGVYGISRPILSNQTKYVTSGYNSVPYDTLEYDGLLYESSGLSSIATDDIYKRVLTWILYRGDGQVFTMQWLKNRISRFINGPNGSDLPVLNLPPSITVSGNTFTISSFAGPVFTALNQLINNRSIPVPFQYDFVFVGVSFINDGGVLQMSSPLDYPTTSTGLAAGAIWYNGGTVSVVPGITPSPTAPAVYFASLDPATFLSLGGGNLPLTNPANTGQLWNNGGLVSIS